MFKGVVNSEIEDNKGIIRNRKSEDKQQNDKERKGHIMIYKALLRKLKTE
jgi:hypothetical protein